MTVLTLPIPKPLRSVGLSEPWLAQPDLDLPSTPLHFAGWFQEHSVIWAQGPRKMKGQPLLSPCPSNKQQPGVWLKYTHSLPFLPSPWFSLEALTGYSLPCPLCTPTTCHSILIAHCTLWHLIHDRPLTLSPNVSLGEQPAHKASCLTSGFSRALQHWVIAAILTVFNSPRQLLFSAHFLMHLLVLHGSMLW